MPDEIKERLQDCCGTCTTAYESWRKDEKSIDARENLQEAIHEIRKVASRLEIELAVSERDQMAQKPIPIPPHRNAKARSKDNNGGGKKPSKRGDSKKGESANDKAPKSNKKTASGDN
ncbi:MAG: hypothetical protein JKY71_08255 [Alphaproteobacteria bacterium]|nr:hypothetical protein [Alphaproteobacteria bacterium]